MSECQDRWLNCKVDGCQTVRADACNHTTVAVLGCRQSLFPASINAAILFFGN